jgi:hypothetical protein
MEYDGFQVEVYERQPGRWRAGIRRLDGSKVRVGDKRFELFYTMDAATADTALDLARKAIDARAVQ